MQLLLFIGGEPHFWTASVIREFHSMYQVPQADTNGYNQAQMDYHSKCPRVHLSGMHPLE